MLFLLSFDILLLTTRHSQRRILHNDLRYVNMGNGIEVMNATSFEKKLLHYGFSMEQVKVIS